MRLSTPAIAFALVLGSCSKPSEPSPAPAARAAATAGLTPDKRASLLRAELRRDPNGVLEEDLTAEDAARRLAAVRSLARIADERSFAALTQALADEAPDVVSWAAFGVGQLCRGRELQAVRQLALRAASLATEPVTDATDRALSGLAFGLGRCASDEAEKVLRSWLSLRAPVAAGATLGLAQVARSRKHLDDATVAALLDAADKNPSGAALHPLESLPTLGAAARERLLEVASKALDQPSAGRAFAVRALAKAGARAAKPLGALLEAAATPDAERADAARSLAALGAAGQAELAAALTSRARSLIDGQAWLSSQHGVVLTVLEGLEPKRADARMLAELAELPLVNEPAPTLRRKVMLRCRAAALLAGRDVDRRELVGCDPSAPAERSEGSLAALKVLSRAPLTGPRGARFAALAASSDRVVREAALELLMSHDELEHLPELLESALSAKEAGVRATAAKVLARYPARAELAGGDGKAPLVSRRVVQALTKQLAEVGTSNNVELSASLLDAAAALSLLGVRPAAERACASGNATLRQHAERAFAQLGEPAHRCPNVPGQETWQAPPGREERLELDTDAGALSLTLAGDESPFAVARFVELARAGFFDGMPVHRVVPGFVVQFGDPDGDGFGGPDLPPLRCQTGMDAFSTGSVGVALAGRDTGGSQFFVTLRPAPHLAAEYSWIGRAEGGWDRLSAGDRIRHVRVLEAGGK
jgi:cyclophilin family peptidyl-prolyl cis-trans isomerase